MEYIDIFLLHEQLSASSLKGHWEAIQELTKLQTQGYIKAIGISTHYVNAVQASLAYPKLDIIHPIYNIDGIGIVDGDAISMYSAISRCYQMGKGIYAMKALGGGHLIKRCDQALNHVYDCKEIASIAIGMQSKHEIQYNIDLYNGKTSSYTKEILSNKKKQLLIHHWCEGCGDCAKLCPQKALYIEQGQAGVDKSKCVLCGYCSRACKQFCIKVI